jgi:SAM-dependent methyltransferase
MAITDQANVEFWNELCGTTFARCLGITDHSKTSLERFDRAYLDFYPYLLRHVNLDRVANRRVLEIGLGYGTLGQKIVEAGADYLGVDIAEVPVRMMHHRLRLSRLPGSCVHGSALSLPLASSSVDFVISIGCLHHTGNIQRGIDEAHRVLKPGGTAFLMVYNQYSYRQWTRWPMSTLRALLRDMGYSTGELRVTEAQRRAYDGSITGRAAPETIFLSIRRLRQMLGRFLRVTFHKENSDNFLRLPRRLWLPSLGRCLGLDIYIQAEK